jgi:hypothetical protein
VTDPIPSRQRLVKPDGLVDGVWERWFAKLARNDKGVATDLAQAQSDVARLLTALQDASGNLPDIDGELSGKQDHSAMLDILSNLPGLGFVERVTGGYIARVLAYTDLPTDDATDGDTLVLTDGVWAPGPASPGNAVIVISDTAPASPTEGLLWANSSDGVLYIYYDDAWVEFGTIGGGTSTSAGGEILVADGMSGPPVMLTNEAEDDFVYSD